MTKKILTKFIIGLSIVFSLTCVSYAKPAALASKGGELDKIVAVVNGDVITKKELDRKIEILKRQGYKQDISTLRKKVLDNLINVLLQLQIAQRNGLSVSDAEVDQVILGIAKDNKFTLSQFKSVLQKEGVAFQEFRSQVRDQLLLKQLQQQFLGRDIVVDEVEIAAMLRDLQKQRNAFAQYHVMDVLVEIPDSATAGQRSKAKKLAGAVMNKLKAGMSVEKVAAKYEKQIQVTDLEWRAVRELPPLFTKVVDGMKKGQVSNIIQAPNGFHVLKLLEIREDETAKLTQEQVKGMVYKKKIEEKIEPWIKELRSNAYIKIY